MSHSLDFIKLDTWWNPVRNVRFNKTLAKIAMTLPTFRFDLTRKSRAVHL